jgi:hypothetical protein
MRLFGYMVVLVDEVRDDERTIWHCTCLRQEEEVPNVKRMRVGEEEVSLSHPITVVVPPEEEEVPIPQGLAVAVPPEEEDVPVPLQPPPVMVPPEEEEVPVL